MFDGLKKKISKAVKFFSEKEEKHIELENNTATNKDNNTEKIIENKNITWQKKEIENVSQITEQKTETLIPKDNMPKIDTNTNSNPEPNKKIENKILEKKEPQLKEEVQKKPETKKSFGIDLSLSTKIKSVVFKKTKLKESEIDGFLEDIKVSMLESDVSYNTVEKFLENLKERILNTEIDSKQIDSELFKFIRESLLSILSKRGVDIIEYVSESVSKKETPVKILFLGPNGTGKTTTIAKLTYMLKNKNFKVVISASDTFRAAAIEQSEYHAKKLEVPIIKSNYGTDPASVAFDAVAYAKARGIDVVMIDSAGRQETNKNLISEIEKMQRVIKPNIIIYVGESVSGNAISEQINEFKKFVNINGIILTKLDCDAKGGNAISIADVTGIPILFFGVGEKYTDLLPYNPNFIVDAIVPAD